MTNSIAQQVKGGRLFHSNEKAYLEGLERGVEFANDGALISHGIHLHYHAEYSYTLIIEDTDEDELSHESM